MLSRMLFFYYWLILFSLVSSETSYSMTITIFILKSNSINSPFKIWITSSIHCLSLYFLFSLFVFFWYWGLNFFMTSYLSAKCLCHWLITLSGWYNQNRTRFKSVLLQSILSQLTKIPSVLYMISSTLGWIGKPWRII